MIYDDIACEFIKMANKVNKNIKIIIEMNLQCFTYNEYGDIDTPIEQNVIINLPNISKKEEDKLCQKKK